MLIKHVLLPYLAVITLEVNADPSGSSVDGYHFMGSDHSMLGGLGMLLLMGTFVVGIVWLIRLLSSRKTNTSKAREILDERLAKGGISIEEYANLKRALEEDGK